ncbi:MAG: FAD:protein FMN transferase [Alloprevotella sp.]
MQLKKRQIAFLLFLIVGTAFILLNRNSLAKATFRTAEGSIFGTTYHIKYEAAQPLDSLILDTLRRVDNSLSLFNQQSTLCRINRGETVEADSMLAKVMRLALSISKVTGGDFDPTVQPLVSAWGFGFEHRANVTPQMIDSLMQFVGSERVNIDAAGVVTRSDPRVKLDFGAIAKGYAVDCVAELLMREGVNNYMVEIGGEVRTAGTNDKGQKWRIGVSRPSEAAGATDNAAVISVNDCAMATSGNYNNYYEVDGKRYAHTISPHTGYPVTHSLLSATVVAPTCAEADAFATAFMAGGMERAQVVLAEAKKAGLSLDAFFIYSDEKGEMKTWETSGMPKP